LQMGTTLSILFDVLIVPGSDHDPAPSRQSLPPIESSGVSRSPLSGANSESGGFASAPAAGQSSRVSSPYPSPASTFPQPPFRHTIPAPLVNVPASANSGGFTTSRTPVEIDGQAAIAIGHARHRSNEQLQAIFNKAVTYCPFCFHFSGIQAHCTDADGNSHCPHWENGRRCFRCYGIHDASGCPIVSRDDLSVLVKGNCYGCCCNMRVLPHRPGELGLKCRFKEWSDTRIVAFVARLFQDSDIMERMARELEVPLRREDLRSFLIWTVQSSGKRWGTGGSMLLNMHFVMKWYFVSYGM
jgi:hypothetical protein